MATPNTFQIGLYKRPGIYINEIDESIISAPSVQGGIVSVVIGSSKLGPYNTAVLLNTPTDLINTYGNIDTQLERKGSFFHRTIATILNSTPVYAIALLPTDKNLDVIDYQSISTSVGYGNDILRTAPYSSFFDTTSFWVRSTDNFLSTVVEAFETFSEVDDAWIANTASNPSNTNLLDLTNLSNNAISVFCYYSQVSGYDVNLTTWYGGVLNVPPYLYPTDLASDYLVDVIVVAGDWSNYANLSVNQMWSPYFNTSGLIKSQIANFINNPNLSVLGYYTGLSLIPYFLDSNGNNIFIETIINNDTNTTGLFCTFNEDALETNYPMGLLDLIGNTIVLDVSVPTTPVDYQTLAENDLYTGKTDGNVGINFLSYDEVISETVTYPNQVLDAPGNVVALFGTNSAVYQNIFTHSYNDSSTVKGGVIYGPNDDVNLSIPKYGQRTYWFAEGYVNDLYRSSAFTIASQSINLSYTINAASNNGYAVIGGAYITFSNTTLTLSPSYYPASAVTQSYVAAFALNTDGIIYTAQSGTPLTTPLVATTDIVLSYATFSVCNGIFVTPSAGLTDVTVNGNSGGGPAAYLPLINGVDYTIATTSTVGALTVTFLGTNMSPIVNSYQTYRRFKTFNAMLSYIDSPTTYQSLMLLSPQVPGVNGTVKLSMSGVTVSNIVTSTAYNSSFTLATGLSASAITSIVQNGELVLYDLDDEFIIDYAGFVTKTTIATLNVATPTASFGVVGQYSTFYSNYFTNEISSGDVFYQNEIYGPVAVTFVPGSSVTASLTGYNYVVFQVNEGQTYHLLNDYFFEAITLGDTEVPGYQFLLGGVLNNGVYSAKYDQGFSSINGFPNPSSAEGEAPYGRAYMLATYSNGYYSFFNSASYSYWAFEVQETVVTELVTVNKIFDFNTTLADAPIFLEMYLDVNNNLNVIYKNFDFTTQVPIDSVSDSITQPLYANTLGYIKSELPDFKISVEVEYPAGWTASPNMILCNRSRYGDISIGNYLEASYDASDLQPGEVPKKLTTILNKTLWTGNSNYLQITCDAAIQLYNFNGYTQTFCYTMIDDYVTTYKAIPLDGFTVRAASLPDGTEATQNTILNLVANGTPLANAITNKDAFDFRYLIDSYGLGLRSQSKQQLVDICGNRLDVFGFINMPSLQEMKNSSSPSFYDSNEEFQIQYVASGGNPETNPAFLYSFGTGLGVSACGYFLPYVTINYNGRPTSVPPSMYVAQTYLRKFNSTLSNLVPWTIAAGVTNGKILGITSLEANFTPDDLNYLNQAQMNPLTFKRNRGYIIETENTAQTLYKSALSYIHVREVLIQIERALTNMLLSFQWQFNTPDVRASIKLNADTICQQFVAQNGIYNYFNKCDAENNTQEVIDDQAGIIDTFLEPIMGMGIIVNNIYILKTGAIQSGGFINVSS